MERRMPVWTHLFGQLSSRTDRALFKHTLTFGPNWHKQFSVIVCFCCFSSIGVGAMTWSPLACGIISGKYGNGVPESSRASLKVFSSTCRKDSQEGQKGRRWVRSKAAAQAGLPSLITLWPWPVMASGRAPSALPRFLVLATDQSALHNLPAQKLRPWGRKEKCPITWLTCRLKSPHSYLFLC